MELFKEAEVLYEKNDFGGALSLLEESSRLDPKNPAIFANLGQIQLLLRRFNAAEVSYKRAAVLEPSNGDHLAGVCLALSEQRKHVDALKACDEAVRLNPASGFAAGARLEANIFAGHDPQILLRLMDLALARFPSDLTILGISSDTAIHVGNYQLAEELLLRLVSIRPQHAKAWGRLAEVQLRLGKDVESLQSARTSLKIDRLDPFGNFAMGSIFFELGEHQEAIESFELIPSDTKYLDDAVYYRALSESRRGRPQVAADLLRPLVERNPNEVTFVAELARNLQNSRRYRESIPYYLRAIELVPNTADLHTSIGNAYMSAVDFKNAIHHLEIANRLKPRDELIQMFLNVSRARLQMAGQLEDFIKYVESRPKDVKARTELVFSLAYMGRIAEAEKYVAEIYALDPPEPEIYQKLGVAYGEADDDDKALDAYRRSLQKGENGGAYLGIAGTLMIRGEFDAAARAFEKVIEIKPDASDIMIGYAKLLRENGKRREALAMYRRSLAIKPMNANALFNAGILSLKLGEPDAANIYLEQLRVVDPVLAKTLLRCIKLRLWN